MPSCATNIFHQRVSEAIPDELQDALRPVIPLIEKTNHEIRSYDNQLAEKCKTKYPEAEPLMQIGGVGAITVRCYVLTLDDLGRFENGRQAGAYQGLVPRKRQSGETNPQLGITKNGDSYLRKLLVQCSQVILGRRGGDSELRRWGLQKAARGGKGARKRAVVAVARKLAIMMYWLWKTGERYQPFPMGRYALINFARKALQRRSDMNRLTANYDRWPRFARQSSCGEPATPHLASPGDSAAPLDRLLTAAGRGHFVR